MSISHTQSATFNNCHNRIKPKLQPETEKNKLANRIYSPKFLYFVLVGYYLGKQIITFKKLSF